MAIMRTYDYLIIFNDGSQKTGTVRAYSSVEAGGKAREIAMKSASAHGGIAEVDVQER